MSRFNKKQKKSNFVVAFGCYFNNLMRKLVEFVDWLDNKIVCRV